jgi:hypothetical protein
MPDHPIYSGRRTVNRTTLRRVLTKLQSGRLWFAWRPIPISTGERIWLRWVMRMETQPLGTLGPEVSAISYERMRWQKAANAP